MQYIELSHFARLKLDSILTWCVVSSGFISTKLSEYFLMVTPKHITTIPVNFIKNLNINNKHHVP